MYVRIFQAHLGQVNYDLLNRNRSSCPIFFQQYIQINPLAWGVTDDLSLNIVNTVVTMERVPVYIYPPFNLHFVIIARVHRDNTN